MPEKTLSRDSSAVHHTYAPMLLGIFCALFFASPARAVSIPCDGDVGTAIAANVGEVIELGAGTCTVSAPVLITKPTTIVGLGEDRTWLQGQLGVFNAAAPLTLIDVKIWRADFKTEVAVRAIGINGSAFIDIQRVQIEGFTVGVIIHASVRDFGTNANGWRLTGVTILGSAHAGVIVRGRDANGGHGAGLRVMTSCERAAKWVDIFGACAGIVDRSFLGNTWTAALIATSIERAASGVVAHPPLISQGETQQSTWLGTYCESDQGEAMVADDTVMIGGFCANVRGNGLRIAGTKFSGMEIRNAKDPKNVVIFRAGNLAASGTFFELVATAIDSSRPLRMKSEIRGAGKGDLCYRRDIANQLVIDRVCQDGTKK